MGAQDLFMLLSCKLSLIGWVFPPWWSVNLHLSLCVYRSHWNIFPEPEEESFLLEFPIDISSMKCPKFCLTIFLRFTCYFSNIVHHWAALSSAQRPKLKFGNNFPLLTLKLVDFALWMFLQCISFLPSSVDSLLVPGPAWHLFLPELLQWPSSWFPSIISHANIRD